MSTERSVFTQVLCLAQGLHSWGTSPMRGHDSQYLCPCELPSLSAKLFPSLQILTCLFLFLFPSCSKICYALPNGPRLPTSPNFILIFNWFPLVVKNLPWKGQAQCLFLQQKHPICFEVLLLLAKCSNICNAWCSFNNNYHPNQRKIGIKNTLNSSKPL